MTDKEYFPILGLELEQIYDLATHQKYDEAQCLINEIRSRSVIQ